MQEWTVPITGTKIEKWTWVEMPLFPNVEAMYNKNMEYIEKGFIEGSVRWLVPGRSYILNITGPEPHRTPRQGIILSTNDGFMTIDRSNQTGIFNMLLEVQLPS